MTAYLNPGKNPINRCSFRKVVTCLSFLNLHCSSEMADEEANKKICQTTGTTTFFPLSSFHDDILTEIFLRLPYPPTLLRCALATKRHLRLISDPAFLRRFRHIHPDPPPLLGFFLDRVAERPFLPLPHLDSDLAAISRAVHFTPPLEDDGSSQTTNWNLLDSTGGLLLLQSSDQRRLAVTDPLAPRRCFVFPCPPLPLSISSSFYFYLLVRESDDKSPFFQVVYIKEQWEGSSDVAVDATVFSSSNGEWRSVSSDIFLNFKSHCYNFSDMMRGNGNMYWWEQNLEFLLMLDVASMRFSTFSVPKLLDIYPMVGETQDGKICIGEFIGSVLRIWLRWTDVDSEDEEDSWVL